MSKVTYNGCRMHLVKTASLTSGTEKDKWGVDVKWGTYRLRVRGVLSQSDVDLPTAGRLTWRDVRHMLMTPRRAFKYEVAGDTILEWNPGDGRPDAGLGPDPVSATVTQVTEGAWFVDFEIVLRIVECEPAHPKAIKEVVSLRWDQSEGFDEAWNSRVTTRGTLVVRADLNRNADDFRRLTIPPILPDYVRVQSDWTLSGSGCELDFVFIDVERDRLPPYPAVKASGRFTVTVAKPGVQRFGQVDLRLDGQKGTSRTVLLVKAFGLALAKMRAEGFAADANGNPAVLLWGTFSEDLFEPSVQVSMQARLSELGKAEIAEAANRGDVIGGFGGVAAPAVMASVGRFPGNDAQNRPGLAPPDRKRLVGLIAAAFRDPCAVAEISRPSPKAQGLGPNPDISGGPQQGQVTIQIGPTGGLGSGGGGDYSDNAPYDHYEVRSEYTYDPGKWVLPGTGSGPDGHKGTKVTLHGGTMALVVSWFAARTGKPPVLPTFTTTDPNFVEMPSVVMPMQVIPSADGGATSYEVAGRYSYVVLDPSIVSVTAPVPPFLADKSQRAAGEATRYGSAGVLWGFSGSDGPNPFMGRVNESGPQPTVGVAGQIGTIGAGNNQPLPEGGLGGQQSGGYLGGPQVNP